MFKRIVKVVGIVILGFVLLFGGVIGFMALRGDFKKKVIKPTAITFTIPGKELIFDVGVDEAKVHSFTISAEPLDVTETECTLQLSNSLITIVKNVDGKWVKDNSNIFHINKPIYFIVNDVVSDSSNHEFAINENDYYDGTVEITIIDKSALLKDTISLVIDRRVTSISFKDQGKSENNVIANG
jgi:hypothetical protein